MNRVISQQGDVVDLICQRHYGHTGGITEQVLDSNPGLAEYGATLPQGIKITLPDAPAATQIQQPTINLWD